MIGGKKTFAVMEKGIAGKKWNHANLRFSRSSCPPSNGSSYSAIFLIPIVSVILPSGNCVSCTRDFDRLNALGKSM